jgi:hypothetical protein
MRLREQVQEALSPAAGEAGRGVEDLELPGGWFGAGEVAAGGEEFESGDQVGGDGLDAVPGGVDGVLIGGQAAGAGGVAADRTGCKIWVYWARYGQYDVSLDYTSIDAPVPPDQFATHVQALDRHPAAASVPASETPT